MIQSAIRRAHSCADDARTAVREFHAGVTQPGIELVVFFCSSDYDLDALASEMNRLFSGIRVVGCTTGGEIGQAGYVEHSLTGVSFASSAFTAICDRLEDLQQFRMSQGHAFTQALLREFDRRVPAGEANRSFALLLIDGLSVREELVTRVMQSALGKTPLVGCSAGDGIRFQRTQVFCHGRFSVDSAVLVVVSTALPFEVFNTQHFVPGDERLVVTRADPAQRVVYEINGLPAVQEYARVLGRAVQDITLACYTTHPVVVVIDGEGYLRSIQRINADGSLNFCCAIDNGVVFRIASAGNLQENLAGTLARLRAKVGPPALVLTGDCVYRKLEIDQSPDREAIVRRLLDHCVTGFCTYGEQINGIHLNQTMVGVAIGGALQEGSEPADA